MSLKQPRPIPPKKIALIIRNLQGGGGERIVINLAKALTSIGCECHIFLFENKIELPVPAKIPIHIFPENIEQIKIPLIRGLPKNIRKKITSLKIDRFIIDKMGCPDLVLSNLMKSDKLMCYSNLNVYIVLHKACKRHGIEITATITTANSLQAPELTAPLLKENDLILLNGEGTLHDDRSRALALLHTIHLAKKYGLKTVLYNALWSNNPSGLKYIPDFDLIFCRDSSSAQEIRHHHSGTHVTTVLDMIFSTTFDNNPNKKESVLITDAVKKRKSIPLAKFAINNNFIFCPMGSNFFDAVKSSPILRWKLKQKSAYHHNQLDSPTSYIRKILNSSGVITGRFHTACLALLLETPVFSLSSNTRKIENLYTDLGLSSTLIPHSINTLEDTQAQWQEQINQRNQINLRIAEATQQIDLMFKQISNL